uniref:C-X-C motif chemokine 3-like n=1 Tax=Callorhinchus milii TaxID=7868 RepID=A0A4W3I0D3_CALMI
MSCVLRVASLLTAVLYLLSQSSEVKANLNPLRCFCLKLIDTVPPQYIKNFEIIPRGSHCKNTEIILTWQVRDKEMKSCLNTNGRGREKLTPRHCRIQNDSSKKNECIRRMKRRRRGNRKGRKSSRRSQATPEQH